MELTEAQKTNLGYAMENAEALADVDGDWQHDLASVVDAGGTIAWLLKEAFPFLGEEDND